MRFSDVWTALVILLAIGLWVYSIVLVGSHEYSHATYELLVGAILLYQRGFLKRDDH